MELTNRIAFGLLWSCAIALFALRRGSLSRSGATAAVAVGTSIYAGGGGAWFSALVAFFVSSTLLGRVGRARKEATKREFEKGDTRDGWQVVSNGGAAALIALAAIARPSAWLTAGFLGALATANADTWATELGVLSRGEPRSLLGFARVPRGTSGAVSPLGLAATVGGAGLIGVVALAPGFGLGAAAVPIAVIAGTFGSLVDSLLGSTVQAGFHCLACDRDTEGPTHHCGRRTKHTRGLLWFGNDLVNATATVAGALTAAAIHRLF
jgi:uncharacterized protein (TIGR00297 family)